MYLRIAIFDLLLFLSKALCIGQGMPIFDSLLKVNIISMKEDDTGKVSLTLDVENKHKAKEVWISCYSWNSFALKSRYTKHDWHCAMRPEAFSTTNFVFLSKYKHKLCKYRTLPATLRCISAFELYPHTFKALLPNEHFTIEISMPKSYFAYSPKYLQIIFFAYYPPPKPADPLFLYPHPHTSVCFKYEKMPVAGYMEKFVGDFDETELADGIIQSLHTSPDPKQVFQRIQSEFIKLPRVVKQK